MSMDKSAQKRSITDRVKEKLDLSTHTLSLFDRQFADYMATLREADDSARKQAMELKPLLKTSKTLLGGDDFLGAAAKLVSFYSILEQMMKSFDALTKKLTDERHKLLVDHLDDDTKKDLVKYYKRNKKTAAEEAQFIKNADVMNWFAGKFNARRRALRALEKRVPQLKELRAQTKQQYVAAEKLLDGLVKVFNSLSKARSKGDINAYHIALNDLNRSVQPVKGKFDAFYDKTVAPLMEYLEKKMEENAASKELESLEPSELRSSNPYYDEEKTSPMAHPTVGEEFNPKEEHKLPNFRTQLPGNFVNPYTFESGKAPESSDELSWTPSELFPSGIPSAPLDTVRDGKVPSHEWTPSEIFPSGVPSVPMNTIRENEGPTHYNFGPHTLKGRPAPQANEPVMTSPVTFRYAPEDVAPATQTSQQLSDMAPTPRRSETPATLRSGPVSEVSLPETQQTPVSSRVGPHTPTPEQLTMQYPAPATPRAPHSAPAPSSDSDMYSPSWAERRMMPSMPRADEGFAPPQARPAEAPVAPAMKPKGKTRRPMTPEEKAQRAKKVEAPAVRVPENKVGPSVSPIDGKPLPLKPPGRTAQQHSEFFTKLAGISDIAKIAQEIISYSEILEETDPEASIKLLTIAEGLISK